METIINSENKDEKLVQIKDIYTDDHWTKEYSVTTEELRNQEPGLGITARILSATVKNKVLSF